jgi:hypothetical protein
MIGSYHAAPLQACMPARAAKAQVLAWWAFQPGHQVVCQAWSRAKIECGRFIAILRMGQSAQRWTFSMRNALIAMFPRSGLNLIVVSILNSPFS